MSEEAKRALSSSGSISSSKEHLEVEFPSIPNVVHAVNLRLIRCAALLANDEPGRGLQAAEDALQVAENDSLYNMVSKSHLYRGQCLLKLERWQEASEAFTLAANVKGWATRVGQLKSFADKKLEEDRR